MRTPIFSLLITGLLCIPTCRGEDVTLKQLARMVAVRINEILDIEAIDPRQIQLESFDVKRAGDRPRATSTTRGFDQFVRDHLKSRRITTDGMNVVVRGKFEFPEEDDHVAFWFEGEILVTDSKGRVRPFRIDRFSANLKSTPGENETRITVNDLPAEVTLASVTFDASRETELKEVAREIRSQAGEFRDPPVLRGSRVCPSEKSVFSMEIVALTPRGYVPRPVTNLNDSAFAQLQKGDVIAVRVHNRGTSTMAVELTLDGLNCFSFSEDPAFPRLGKFVLYGHSTLEIPGWYVNSSKYQQFKLTSPDLGAVAILGAPDPAALGAISVKLFRVRLPGEQPMVRRKGIPRIESELRVSPGEDVHQHTEKVRGTVEAVPEAAISIRYQHDP